MDPLDLGTRRLARCEHAAALAIEHAEIAKCVVHGDEPSRLERVIFAVNVRREPWVPQESRSAHDLGLCA
jgi:hypothetical protein